ncbi:MAG: XdhC family protein, partial [Candidatus Fermentibacteraceae bacterium]|nr:XdhC family protein [Candidatus Fermentibacteraceae bacterium]
RWIVSPYGSAREHMDQGEHSWAVIMTPGHRADAEVLGSLSGMALRYVGMMASSAKRAAVYRELLQNGAPAGFLEGVHCPIGLTIGSRTPKEIAVSIAAELIGIRSGTVFRSPGPIPR